MAITVHGTTKPAKVSQQKIKELKKLYGDMQGLFLAALEKAIRMGEVLTEIKEELPHGQFLKWLDGAGLPFKVSSAQLYMQLHRRRTELSQAGISGIREAQIFLSSGGNIDNANTQSIGHLKTQTTSIKAGSGAITVYDDDALSSVKLTARERSLVDAITAAGADRDAVERGIRAKKLVDAEDRRRRAEERHRKQKETGGDVVATKIPRNTYRRFQRIAKQTGKPLADVLADAAEALRRKKR